ncbi:hypothetical protein U5801_16285 [Lamprobacter modestohalophilus]|uniref:hypothetical protein n=1 Tax=Lamprobacter modestohalophilus TaxID=1064514 RepID=UPI002ADECEA5|nr:hypothetical protein [Lamprobacter modestohalophilus]MEA1051352.1 hypothetical protein [Lamprobacter modestohalophilus]
MRHLLPFCCASALFVTSLDALAVETAPRISDREIIESLTRLDAGQSTLEQRLTALEQRMDQRFTAMERTMDQRFAAIEKTMDQRFAAVEKRLDDLFAMMLTMFSALVLLIVSLFGYIVWDRRTALRPLESRLARLEQDLERDLQLRHEEGSLLTRLLKALRELAREDEKLANVLRSFSVL